MQALGIIDPKAAPQIPLPADLPVLPRACLTASALRESFSQPIAEQAQNDAFDASADPAPANLVPAAVLIALIEADPATAQRGDLDVLFTLRTQTLSSHAGQIAFPGGKIDPTDLSPCACAVREAHEEVDLHPRFIEVLGSLPIYATPKYTITPVLALLRPGFTLKPNPSEVDATFTVPLSFLMDPRKHICQTYNNRRWFAMPYVETAHGDETGPAKEHYIWGVSAGILRALYHFLRYSCAKHTSQDLDTPDTRLRNP